MGPASASVTGSDPRLRDALVLAWCVLWVVVGVWVGIEIWSLTRLSASVRQSGEAVAQAGRALESFSSLPVVGSTAGSVGTEVRRSGESIVAQSGGARAGVARVAVLLGLTTAVVPATPVVGVYLPRRLRERHEAREAQALLAGPDAADADVYLALRAVARVPYAELARVVPHPAAALRAGNYRALADAELARLGLRRATAASTPRPPA